ncbi:MAG: DNA translocase FtsK, partial [Chloroflexota bacterium]
MARKKAASKAKMPAGQNRQKPSGRSGWGRFFHIMVSTPVRQLIMLAVILAVLFWQKQNITAAGTSLVEALGWGLVFLVSAVAILAVQLWRRRPGTFITRWNRWLGGAVIAMAVWGILAFFQGSGVLSDFSLGGKFGRGIISYQSPEFIGILRVAGLAIFGIVLAAPRACFRLTARFAGWLTRQFERRPRPQTRPATRAAAHSDFDEALRDIVRAGKTVEMKPPLPHEMEKPLMPPEMNAAISAIAALTPPKPGAAAAKQELRQIAQEVWKKYGQSSDLVVVDGWKLPPIDILDSSPEIQFGEADNIRRAKLIEDALASYGVDAKVVQINAGPTVTQFGVEPGWDRKLKEVKEKDKDGNVQVHMEEVSKTRVKVERITSLANDMALALASPSIRMEAPVPGKSVVGIEVPNTISSLVSLRGVVETSAFQKLLAKSKMSLALGKGAGGEAIVADLTKMPHLLIAGATGSGKTVCLNTIISCLLLCNTPNDVRFIMVDPKRVELTPYNSIPHLAVPVIVDTTKALNSLRWLSQEMDQRYQKMAAATARNIEGYNKNKQGADRLPYLVLIIDELADLMMAGYDEVETILCRLAQLSRATGIHLVVATQRPSVDVVTGLIKANFPTRISFAVTSQVDSRTILDTGGAEKLLGRGDMLFMPTEAAKPK